MSNVAVIEQPRPNLISGGRVAAIVPQSMDEAYRMAKAVCLAGMAPRGMDTPEKAMIAIMRGLEVGLTPFQALDKIAVVNGRPTIWGDGAMALVRGSSLCESIRETIEGQGEAMVATCRAKRRGEVEPIVGVFSVADAKKAGLWGKQGPWQQFPKRMLQMRARAFCLRDAFADVLGGLYIREEIEESAPRQIAHEPPAPPPPPVAKIEPPEPRAPPEPPEPPPPPGQPTDAEIERSQSRIGALFEAAGVATGPIDFDAFRDAMNAATSLEDVNSIYEREVERRVPPLDGDDMDECDRIAREAGARFWEEDVAELASGKRTSGQ